MGTVTHFGQKCLCPAGCAALVNNQQQPKVEPKTHRMSRHSLITPAEVQRRITEGEPIVVFDGYALDLSQWIETHPGGRLAILHMVGRDATDEINMSVFLKPAWRRSA